MPVKKTSLKKKRGWVPLLRDKSSKSRRGGGILEKEKEKLFAPPLEGEGVLRMRSLKDERRRRKLISITPVVRG